jgi:hypothetical protein
LASPSINTKPHHVPVHDLILLESVRVRLAVVWLTAGLLIVTTVIFQSLFHHFQGKTDEVWKWLLPLLMPTLGMVVSVLGSSALFPLFSGAVVRKSFYRIAELLSIFYLIFILLTILIQPFVSASVDEQIASFHTSNLWLGPFQGLVASALGVLFASKHSAKGASEPADNQDDS